ncbi:MAG: glucose-1-phosphate thymidylyltransferase [Bacteroidetes bacterium]|nr:MAG: glucose-1-phosphate thymidylyltransferase [Bacteroidota bacterium]
MKAVIPVAGIGSNLRPHTHTQPKPLIPVAGKPILGHIIDNLIEAGVTQQVFIVGYLKEKIETYVADQYGDQIEAEFVVQTPRRGLAHAIWTAREKLAGEPEILIVLGDTIFGEDTGKVLATTGSVLAVHQVDDPREFGIAMLDEQMRVKRVIEKPQIPTSNLALVGLYKIVEVELLLSVLDSMMEEERPPEGEYLLTDALMQMIRQGVRFRTHTVTNWFDCGRKQTLLETNRILLGRQKGSLADRFPGSVIIPPVFIAEGCTITSSIIGPYVAIGEYASITNSIVRNSILGAYTELDYIILNNSVIGNDTLLRGKSNSINIGDNAEIDFDQ